MASKNTIARAVRDADLVIGAALVVGDKAPKLINRSLLAEMQTGAALVDISIDQGGCFESSHPTSHDAPTFIEQGIVHYCVTNMLGRRCPNVHPSVEQRHTALSYGPR
jgi:alanine dehydrogenase